MNFLLYVFLIFCILIVLASKFQDKLSKVTANNFRLITIDVDKNTIKKTSLITGGQID